jgi:hypothetical protein
VRCWTLDKADENMAPQKKMADDVSPFSIVPGCPNVTNLVLQSGFLFSSVGDRGWGSLDMPQFSPLVMYEERAW